MIKCPGCGGEVKFNAITQKVKCDYCGTEYEPSEVKEKVDVSGEQKKSSDEKYEGKAYTCSQCGATLMTFDDTAITFCSYCGSQAMLEDKMMEQNNPDFVIPFKKTKEQCIEAYKNKVSKFLFAPDYMKSDITVEKFRGIYMPYAIYNLTKKGNVSNTGSTYARRRGDYVYYNDYNITSDIDALYEGVSCDLVSKFYDNYSTAIPFNYKEAVEFNPAYLTGYYADSLDVDANVYDDDVKQLIQPDITKRLKQNKQFSKYGCSSPKIDYLDSSKKIGMFPTYFLAIRDKKNESIHYGVVNGQTGEVAADLPISFGKYILASIVLSIIIFLIINSFLILTPTKVGFFSIVVAIISTIFSKSQLKKLNSKASHEDDKGYINAHEEKKTSDKKEKAVKGFKYLYKEILAIIIPMLPIILNAVNDYYYYIASIISLILIVLSFYDLVKEHNLLVSNKLPQLEKRGGEEDE